MQNIKLKFFLFFFENTLKFLIKTIVGVSHDFYKLILFYRVFTKLQVAFYCFKKFKLFYEI